MTLDIQSLLVVAVLSGAVLVWSMAVLRHRAPDRPEAGLWLGAGLALTVGFGLIAARGAVPDVLSIVAANLLIVLGLWGLMAGVEVYCGRRPARWLPAVVLTATLAGFLWFTLAEPDTAARILIVTGASALLSGRAAWLLYRPADTHPRVRSLHRAVGLPFLLHALVSSGRGVATLAFDRDLAGFLAAGTLQGAFVLEVIVFLAMTTVSLTFLIVARESRRTEDVIWATGVGTWDWMMDTGAVRVNARWAEMLGHSLDEVTPVTVDTWRRLLHPDDAPEVEHRLRAHLEGHESQFECAARLRRRDGGWLWVRHRGRVVERARDGRPIRMTGTHRDITHEVERTADADRHRALLTNLARQVPGLLYQFQRRPDGSYRMPYASDRLVDVFGVPPAAVMEDATPVMERIHPDDRNRLILEIEESAERLAPWRSEYRVTLPDGSVLWHEGFAMPERLEDGSVLWHGFIANVNARFEKQQALEQYAVEMEFTKQQLEEQASILVELAEQQSATSETLAREVATKNRFFSIVAHDLRSPFTPLLGMTELLAQSAGTLPPATVAGYAADIHASARRLFTLVEQLLDWGRVQMGSDAYRPEDVALAPAVADLLDQAREVADAKGVPLESRVPPDVTAFVDPNVLRTIVRNLVSNAVKFTPRGGRVWIDGDGADGTARLSVQDTGVGIAPDVRASLFDVAVKTTTRGTDGEPGTGLGLPTCAELAHLSDGHITAEAGPDGVGTVMRLTLPATAPHAAADPEGDTAGAPDSGTADARLTVR
jgi:PAS domain S-box-containing protein